MIKATVLDRNTAHVRVRLGVGPDEHHLATAGIVTFRCEEWDGEAKPALAHGGWWIVDYDVPSDGGPPPRPTVTVDLRSATSALRDMATLLEQTGDVRFTINGLRRLADRYEEMAGA